MNRKEAFARYGAKLANAMWAVSARLPDKVVMSLWSDHFEQGRLEVYRDRVSRWSGAGNSLFRKHLQEALDEGLPIDLVKATSPNPGAVERGEDASQFKNSFSVRPELVGAVESFDGDEFVIRFRQR